MKFCIPIEDRPWGGMYSFLANFRTYLKQMGVSVTNDIEDIYDVLFVNSFVVPYALVRRAKKRLQRLRVVQRVDGSARDYGGTDGADACQARVNTLADLTIFQSQYGKKAITEKFKIISMEGPVIYNPVDIQSFCPDGERIELPGRIKVCHVTFSTNPLKGAASVYDVARRNPDIDFILIGRYEEPPQLANLHLLGVLDRQTLPKALRSCDLFLTFSENESCPNVVLESLATGLPVLYKNSGGVPEIVGSCGSSVEVTNFREQLDELLKKQKDYSLAARARAQGLFAPEIIFRQYLDSISKANRNPFPKRRELLKLVVQGYPVVCLFRNE
jgi:glycosyltransferase involved in cell wall biosynthesis